MADGDRVDLWSLADLRTPWCVHVVATLDIARHLADGPRAVDDLAAATGCDVAALRRVLRHLVSEGVFEEPASDAYALNDAAQPLLDPGTRAFLDLDGVGGRIAHAWGTLLTVVRTGKPGYQDVFGRPFWEDLDANSEIGASFDALMHEGHAAMGPEVLLRGDWESVRSVVDVGGGTGGMLAAILRAHPDLRGTLVDLPRAVARATEVFRSAGVADRADAVEQSFFDPLPAGADLYLLSAVLNDWPEPEATAILRRCAEAVPPSGRVVVMGGVIPDGERDDALTPELVLVGGTNRSLAAFRRSALAVGLEVQHAGRLPSGRFAVECRPVRENKPEGGSDGSPRP